MRGWSLVCFDPSGWIGVVPAHAGVVPRPAAQSAERSSGPRACGGGPPTPPAPSWSAPWSPRTRGWSHAVELVADLLVVVPAHAGVVPGRPSWRRWCGGGPRARGGGPSSEPSRARRSWWSPRTRGWSLPRQGVNLVRGVVPAHAGVVLCPPSLSSGPVRGPRARGGGPAAAFVKSSHPRWSPRTRGWSLSVSTSLLEKFGGPRARGGGPSLESGISTVMMWSPRTRGWSLAPKVWCTQKLVVPAHAGVVPAHAGVVPPHHSRSPGLNLWSPRTRGWSRSRHCPQCSPSVVLAHAGVGPCPWATAHRAARGPHARGGGPRRSCVHPVTFGWSPRTRGWSRVRGVAGAVEAGVPAHAGAQREWSRSSHRSPDEEQPTGSGRLAVALDVVFPCALGVVSDVCVVGVAEGVGDVKAVTAGVVLVQSAPLPVVLAEAVDAVGAQGEEDEPVVDAMATRTRRPQEPQTHGRFGLRGLRRRRGRRPWRAGRGVLRRAGGW